MTRVDLTSIAGFVTPGWFANVNTRNWLDAAYERLPATLILWGGLILLSLALVVLMRTRWAQSRPVACCVALSIFAHVLLFSYAYGTRLILAVPVSENVEPIPIELVDAPEPNEPDPEVEAEANAAPWDELVGAEGLRLETSSPPAMEEAEQIQPTERQMSKPVEVRPADTRLVTRSIASEPQRPPLETVAPLPFERAAQAFSAASLERPVLDVDRNLQPPDFPTQLTANSPSSLLTQPTPPVSPQPARSAGDVEFDPMLQMLTESLFDPEIAQTVTGPERLDPTRIVRDPSRYSPAGVRADNVASPPSPSSTAIPTSASRQAQPQGNELVEQLITQPRTRLGDGRPVPEPFRLRQADHRLDIALARGGTAKTEAAVRAGLQWLAKVQRDDGGWDADVHGGGQETSVLGHERGGAGAEADMGISGLAILSFLSAGYTHLEGDYREVVSAGLSYLMSQQAADGNLHGNARLFARMYCHGMALFALSEAYSMTGDHGLREAVAAGLQYTVKAQHPSSGGWRYQPGDEGDMSQFGWQVMAIKSADLAGVSIPRKTHADMHLFLNSCCRGNFGGLASYRPREKISPTMTAEALVCRLLLEERPSIELIREAQGAIALGSQSAGLGLVASDASRRRSDQEAIHQGEAADRELSQQLNLYFLYYGTLAMFLAQDDAWATWNQYLQNELLPTQVQDGTDAGSWNPNTIWGGYGGRVYSTAMATLCLEVYYRYLPLYQVNPDDAAAAETARRALNDFRLPR